MRINAQEFFREAALRIGSSLDVGTFLYRSFMDIRDVIPADQIALVYYDSDYALTRFHAEKGKLVLLAAASVDGGALYNTSIPLLPEVIDFIKQSLAIKRQRLSGGLRTILRQNPGAMPDWSGKIPHYSSSACSPKTR